MKETQARALYSALLVALSPLYRLRLWWRGRAEPLYREAVAERFGRYADNEGKPGSVWIHAVSLGETRATAALIDALREARPGVRVLLTHGTATGREAGRELLRPGDRQTWLPYDTPSAVRRFYRHWQPAVGVLMETEVWPNLLQGAQAAAVPVLLANARLSERSLAKGRRWDVLLRPAFAALSRVLAQTQADADRLVVAGASRVEAMGNVKFDAAPDALLLVRGATWARASRLPLVLAASTREGEEAPLLDAWAALPAPRPRLLLVPRHPQRFDEVAALVERSGLPLSRRSTWPHGAPDAQAQSAAVWLGDSMGELPAYYACASVALLGGSFEKLGGQNLIEAAACGCPVVMGPHTFNFAEAAELSLAAGASERVATLAEGVARAAALADDSVAQAGMAQRALTFAAAHRGAAQRMAGAIVEVIERRGEPRIRDSR
ncbi:MAG: 3-deoxy-D-manno-octulosonic acid transferase [Methylibium sp.]|uniref:3-deoxy-D-manno-octulosonic acid transferase n=1 Tax=Methylibium sp. TaxID=2067992 RepID=UPI0017CD27F2|nr:3-deoxy-D-manno-octulosonic acid transferase [Methylibium sp.]MBA3598082.1 3-deoxy-D-manno-octulosonic acid transferase [Methylibium sp.]